jgi:hypothetical protein
MMTLASRLIRNIPVLGDGGGDSKYPTDGLFMFYDMQKFDDGIVKADANASFKGDLKFYQNDINTVVPSISVTSDGILFNNGLFATAGNQMLTSGLNKYEFTVILVSKMNNKVSGNNYIHSFNPYTESICSYFSGRGSNQVFSGDVETSASIGKTLSITTCANLSIEVIKKDATGKNKYSKKLINPVNVFDTDYLSFGGIFNGNTLSSKCDAYIDKFLFYNRKLTQQEIDKILE